MLNTTIVYGQVPEDFVPEIPDLETLEEVRLTINMFEKSKVGSLIQVRVIKFDASDLRFAGFPSDFEGRDREILLEDYGVLYDADAVVMKCYYSLPGYDYPDGGFYPDGAFDVSFLRFWFGSTPSVADPDRLRDRMPEHPLLIMKGARSLCPASQGLAYAQVGGKWDPTFRGAGGSYIRLSYDRTTDDGVRDVYRYSAFVTPARGDALRVSDGTLTVNADGRGYLEYSEIRSTGGSVHSETFQTTF